MTEKSLTLTRTYSVPPEKVFQAWSDKALLPKWFSPTPEMKVPIVEVDFREGGKYRIGMESPDGKETYIAVGEYKEIEKNKKIVMTWRWENWPDDQPDSVLSIELASKDGGTELTLKHEQLESDDSVQKHTEGWTGCLARLEADGLSS